MPMRPKPFNMKGLTVFFRASVTFSDKINRDFWRKFREDKDPFITLTAVGGVKSGHFYGSITLDLKRGSRKRLAYEITSALVQKIELLSSVGVANIEFEEITKGVK